VKSLTPALASLSPPNDVLRPPLATTID